MLIAALIFLFTLVLVIWQPRGLNIGWSAALGAALALLFGVVSPADIPVVWNIVWNATVTFIALIVISLILDEAGFFRWAALHVGRWGGGRGRWLFVLVVLLGACVSALFANDGTALILTPIVLEMLLALGFSAGATLALIMATGFIADAASLPLVISNLVNIVSADYFDITFAEYASVMFWVNIASVLASLAVLQWYFRRQIPRTYRVDGLASPAGAIRDPAVFRIGWVVLGVLLIGYFAAGPLNIPVSVIAVVGAALLWLVAAGGQVISTRRVLRGAPWNVVIFSLGMYLVVYGLRNAGLTGVLTGTLEALAQGGLWLATLGTGFLIAALASVMNNMPTVLIGALSIDAAQVPPQVRQGMIYANVVGSDLGPKITPIGSLATLLWLHVLARKGVRISWGEYFKVGIVLTIPVLLITLVALVVRLSL